MKKSKSFWKINLLIGLLALILCSDCLADSLLSVPRKIQEHSQWCWAGSSQSVLAYYNSSDYPSQCKIANWAWDRTDCCGNFVFDWRSACNKPNSLSTGDGSLRAILEHWGVKSDFINSYLDQSTARTELDAGRPFVMRFGWTGGGGHFLVGRGMIGNRLNYMDPWPGNGYTISSYDWVVSASDHSWTHTLQITTDYSEPKVTITATDGSASEGGADSGAFKVSRAGSSTVSPLTVNYTVGGSATSGADYKGLPGSVIIPAGRSSATIPVTPKDDSTFETRETVIVTLSAEPTYSVDFPDSAQVSIRDNEIKDTYESDNLPTMAKTILSGETQYRSLHKAQDVDWAKFTLDQTSEVTIETNGVTGGDTVIALFGPNTPLTLIVKDNDSGVGHFSLIHRTGAQALEPGTYYIRVRQYGMNAAISRYTLSLLAQPVE
ncbi:MAG: DVUA0089 family protein [Syntrophobacter sp.]